jgi:membrane protease YdiL (CAAX protease family)
MDRRIKAALGIFIFSYFMRVVDIFLLNSPAYWRSIILSKAIPLLALFYIVCYVEKVGLGYIGLSRRDFLKNILLGLVLLFFTLGFNYLPDTLLNTLYRVPFRTPYFYFGLGTAYYLFFCVVNGFMEEGVFRGYMQRKFYHLGKWNAIFIQAILFGLWHIVWTFYNFYSFSTGWMVGFSYVLEYTISYVFFTIIFGIIMGYVYLKTGCLWASVFTHTFYNFLLNYLLFNESRVAGLIKFLGYPLMGAICLLSIRFLTEKMKIKEREEV